jgi:hypothetical protein
MNLHMHDNNLTTEETLPSSLTPKLYIQVRLHILQEENTRLFSASGKSSSCWYVSALELPRTPTDATGARAIYINYLPFLFATLRLLLCLECRDAGEVVVIVFCW